jgi:hypothetical protein
MKPHGRFFIANYHIYGTDRFPGRKDKTASVIRKGIPHNHVDLSPLVSIAAIGNSEVYLQQFLSHQTTPGIML